jgi:hypothetical protein
MIITLSKLGRGVQQKLKLSGHAAPTYSLKFGICFELLPEFHMGVLWFRILWIALAFWGKMRGALNKGYVPNGTFSN